MNMSVRFRLVMQCGVVTATALVVGCGSTSDITDRIAGHRASPFALFGRTDMRAGMRYETLREAAKKESVRQYECLPLWAKAQRCSVVIESGALIAIVDSSGRVIRLLATTDPMLRGADMHGQLLLRDVVRDTRMAWDSVGALHRNDGDPLAPELFWLDRTQRWSGTLWYSRAHRADVPAASSAATDAELAMTLPESIGVTDSPAYALFWQLHPAPREVRRIVPVAPPPVPPSADDILTMLRSDLRALTIAEEETVHRAGAYETHLDHLNLAPSPGVRVELLHATVDGWSAMATHAGLPGMSCVVYAGDVATPPATRKSGRRGIAGEVACDRL